MFTTKTAHDGLRPFDPLFHLGGMVALMETAFSAGMTASERAAMNELRLMRYLPPLWALGGVFTGYVWLANGRVVGNATLTRLDEEGRRWQISNVAVDPKFRRRGIARQLMRVALDRLRSHGAWWALLEVRAENIAAQGLYRELGFACLEAFSEMRLEHIGPIEPSEGLALRSASLGDGQRLYQLAKISTPKEWREARPLDEAAFGFGWESWLAEKMLSLLHIRDVRRWAIGEAELEAALTIEAQQLSFDPHASHRLQVLVHPDRRGRFEDDLVAIGLQALRDYHRRPVEAKVARSHPELVAALERFGFTATRTLEQWGVRLN
jgi:GNAT superfamily N-acetyltransferase